MKFHFLRICCLGWLLMQPLHGQPPDLEEREVTGRRAWIVSTSIPEDVDNPLLVLSGEELHKVKLHLRSIGNPVPLDKTGLVRAVKSVTKPDGTLAYKDLSRNVIPEGVREALIVLTPKAEKPEGGDGLRFDSKVIDLSKFKQGGCLYVNLTKANLGITIGKPKTAGEQKTVVKPGGMEIVNMQGNDKVAVKPIRFFYEIPKKPKAEWKLMTAANIAIYKSRREICIFFFNEDRDNVDFRGISFITPPARPR